MKFKKRDLQHFIYDTITPFRLFNSELTPADFEKWSQFLVDLRCQFQLKLSEELYGNAATTYKHEFLKSFQKYLLMLSNTVQYYLTKDFKVWYTSPNSHLIRIHYIRTLQFLDDVLDKAAKQHGEYFDTSVALTNFKRMQVIPEIKTKAANLSRHFREVGLNPGLINIFHEGVNNAVRADHFSISKGRYLMHLLNLLQEENITDDQTFLNTLIRGNFNRTWLFGFIIDRCEEMMNGMEGLYEQLELILEKNMDFVQIREESESGLLQDMPSLKVELLEYCEAKSLYLKEMLALRKMAEQDQVSSDQVFKVLLDITVPQFGLLIRLLLDNGVLAKRQVNKLFGFFSRHFYTERTQFISHGSLQSKASNIQFSDALKLYEIFKAITLWLEDQFGLKNYHKALH